jgi:outer membrane murein-binding lipoprotein Lpp
VIFDPILLGSVAGVVGVTASLAGATFPHLRRRRQRDRDIAAAVLGEGARPGVDAQPSMITRFDLIAATLAQHGEILTRAALLNGKGDMLTHDVAAIREDMRELRESQAQASAVANTNIAEVRRELRAVKGTLVRHVKDHH